MSRMKSDGVDVLHLTAAEVVPGAIDELAIREAHFGYVVIDVAEQVYGFECKVHGVNRQPIAHNFNLNIAVEFTLNQSVKGSTMWKIHVGNNVLPTVYANTEQAVQAFMRGQQQDGGDVDAIRDVGVFVVHIETLQPYKLAYQDKDNNRSYVYATCGGGIVLDYLEAMHERLKGERLEDAAMSYWINERERCASVSAKFDSDGVYREHVVVYFDSKIGWIHAKPGDGYREAVRNAMNMRVNYETGEYFDPAC